MTHLMVILLIMGGVTHWSTFLHIITYQTDTLLHPDNTDQKTETDIIRQSGKCLTIKSQSIDNKNGLQEKD